MTGALHHDKYPDRPAGFTSWREGGAVLWDLDTLDAELLEVALAELATFVRRLLAFDVEVPSCWYVHGWVVRRLLALQHWYIAAHEPGSPARAVAEWWSLGLEPLMRDWSRVAQHRGRHAPSGLPWAAAIPTPPVQEVIAEAARLRRERGA